jgi:hypothetical protein
VAFFIVLPDRRGLALARCFVADRIGTLATPRKVDVVGMALLVVAVGNCTPAIVESVAA